MAVEIKILEDHMGEVIRDINARRGRIERVEQAEQTQQQARNMQQITAIAPLAQLLGYAKELQSKIEDLTQLSIEFVRYEAAPLGGDPGGDPAGVTANKPTRPNAGNHSAAANFDQDAQ